MRIEQLDYELPTELIAQRPPEVRDGARMCVLRRGQADFTHSRVHQLAEVLPRSLLVFNDTRVIPARLRGHKPSGGKVELLLLEPTGTTADEWLCMAKPAKTLREGMELSFGELRATVGGRDPQGRLHVTLSAEGSVADALERIGELPLPPYIRRPVGVEDAERYQTVYAREPGAVAAPTAGLHFTPELLAGLEAAGHRTAHVTLHVGPGTFAPVKVDDLDAHPMHRERFDVPASTVGAIEDARREGRPVVAVGTTVVRTLEGVAAANGGRLVAGPGDTNILIQPPYTFQVVEGLLTNFHLPRSTLLALVMAFAGIDVTRAAYTEAVREAYRFFSYGDAMLILPGQMP